ncbi:MAG: hypothetical protein JSV38_15680 [Desulfobacterales bacterium]|nr:MAG: hypothetical protein JSV38_15680 [Desulfobacterales bacterium]
MNFTKIIGLLALILIFACATQTGLKEYQPKSNTEREIIQVVIKAEDAWEAADSDEFIAQFCSNGQFMVAVPGGRGKKEKVSMDELSAQFNSYISVMGDSEFVNPECSISSDEAKVIGRDMNYGIKYELEMKKENGRWCIADYSW